MNVVDAQRSRFAVVSAPTAAWRGFGDDAFNLAKSRRMRLSANNRGNEPLTLSVLRPVVGRNERHSTGKVSSCQVDQRFGNESGGERVD